MTPALPEAELEPLRSPSLAARFPHLADALDTTAITERLQDALFASSPYQVTTCARPRAEIDGDTCTLQTPITVRDYTRDEQRLLVLGTLFPAPGAAMALADDVLAPLAAAWSRIDSAPMRWSAGIQPQSLACSVFPVSSALPQLVRLMAPGHLETMLQSALQDDRIHVAGHELVVFRRTRGCVLRIRVDAPAQRRVYAKVGYAAYGRVATDALDMLRAASAAPGLRLPSVLGRDDELQVTLLAELPGSRADLSKDSARAVDAAARAAALLHACDVPGAPQRTLSDEIARARIAVDAVVTYAPALSAWLRSALLSAEARAGRGADAPVFCHGDMTPSQVLLHEDAPAVLDFDKCCSAERALDLGRYIAYLRLALAKSGGRRGASPTQRFLQAYEAAGGTLPPAARVSAYETVALVRTAARSWLQLKPRRLRLALDLIARG